MLEYDKKAGAEFNQGPVLKIAVFDTCKSHPLAIL